MDVDAAQVLAFRLGRSGLVARRPAGLAEAVACPASDFGRGAALLALAARVEDVSREAYAEAIEDGSLVVAHVVRGAIHALAPGDLPLYGRALVARDDRELAAQIGPHVRRLADEKGFRVGEALEEVAAAVRAALAGGRRLDKNGLHEEMRARVGEDLMPWCRGCGSHHVAPMLWRYATVKVAARLDSERRYMLGSPGRVPAAAEAVRRFLAFYGPSTVGDFAGWAGLAKPHARRLWESVDLKEVRVGGTAAWLLPGDVASLASPPGAEGVRLLPPVDPYLQLPNRRLLTPDPEVRKRLFRPVAGPGAVLVDGRLAGLWRMRMKGRRAELELEWLGQRPRADVAGEADRIARLRGADGVRI